MGAARLRRLVFMLAVVCLAGLATGGWALDGQGSCAWQPVFFVTDLDDETLAMAVYNDGNGPAPCAGGKFTFASGEAVNGVARWNGSTWSPLNGPSGVGLGGYAGCMFEVRALATYDDDSGPALYVGGNFETAGGVVVNGIARWDGRRWSAPSGPDDTGTSAGVTTIATYDDGSGPKLYAAGGFTTAGGLVSSGIVTWRCPVELFADGFEAGTTAAWSVTVP